jgi:deoxyhypusine synthase
MADSGNSNAPPVEVTNAVLVQSEEMPKDAQKVEELDFNKLKGPITAEDLFLGMKNMGFQATSMSEAIRIINDMVSKEIFNTAASVWLTSL